MNTHRCTLPAVLAVLVSAAVLGGCGSDSAGTSADAGTTSSTSSLSSLSSTSSGASDAAETPTEADPDEVVAVSVRRSGGLKGGGDVTVLFSREADPPERFDAEDVDAVLAAAQTVVDDDVQVPAMPANTCCDRYTHVIVVSLADGSSVTYTTLDGMRLPPEMTALLRAAA